jgi:hypothetical protein
MRRGPLFILVVLGLCSSLPCAAQDYSRLIEQESENLIADSETGKTPIQVFASSVLRLQSRWFAMDAETRADIRHIQESQFRNDLNEFLARRPNVREIGYFIQDARNVRASGGADQAETLLFQYRAKLIDYVARTSIAEAAMLEAQIFWMIGAEPPDSPNPRLALSPEDRLKVLHEIFGVAFGKSFNPYSKEFPQGRAMDPQSPEALRLWHHSRDSLGATPEEELSVYGSVLGKAFGNADTIRIATQLASNVFDNHPRLAKEKANNGSLWDRLASKVKNDPVFRCKVQLGKLARHSLRRRK